MLKRLFCIVFIISRVCTCASVPDCVCVCVCASACARVCAHIAGITIEKRSFLHFTTINRYLTTDLCHFMHFAIKNRHFTSNLLGICFSYYLCGVNKNKGHISKHNLTE